MDHQDFIKSLSAGQRRALTEKSDAEGCKALFIHITAIVVIGALILYFPVTT